MLALARVFGTHQSRKGVWQYGSASNPWDDFDAFLNLGREKAAIETWTYQIEPVLESRLQYCGPNDAARLHREIVAALKLIGASYAELYRTVARETPRAQVLGQALMGCQPEDLDGEPPAPVATVVDFHPQDPPFAVDEDPLRRSPTSLISQGPRGFREQRHVGPAGRSRQTSTPLEPAATPPGRADYAPLKS